MRSIETWAFICLLNALWQIPLLFAAAWLAARLVRRIGPSTEHKVWVGALFLQSIMPFCLLRAEGLWQLVQNLAFWSRVAAPRRGTVRVTIGPGTGADIGPLHLPATALALLTIAWAGTLLYFAGRLAWGLARTESMRRHAQPLVLPADQQNRLGRFCRQLCVEQAVEVATSSVVSGPLGLGVAHPALLLPTGFVDHICGPDLDAVFAHELAHIRRRDFAFNLLYGVIALPFAWHPLLRLTRARIAETRELACDAMAADAVQGSENYARSLLRLAAMLPDRAAPGVLHAIGIFDANIFERRIMNLVRKHPEVRGLRRFATVVACGLIALTAGASALALRVGAGVAPSQQTNPKQIHVKAESMTILYKVNPVYPADAKKNKDTIDGSVLLDVTIGTNGSAEHVAVSKSLRSDYDRSAVDAVSQWRWQPVLLNGDPVEVKTTVTVTYSIKP